MVTIRQASSYVTMINYFQVAEKDQREFAQVEVEEIEKYGAEMDGALAASFHRSLTGNRVFNYAQWESKEALQASQETEAFKQHLERMSHLDFTPDPKVYEIIELFSLEENPKVQQENTITPVLTMVFTRPDTQAKIIELFQKEFKDHIISSQFTGLVSSHLLRSKDGERVALYTQWNNESITLTREVEELSRTTLNQIKSLSEEFESLAYEVVGVYNPS
ncbi:MAG: antibiotic biosynthesis monooxygenase family protein [Microcoleaceae cyanobacterium]